MKHGTPSRANRGPKNPGRSAQLEKHGFIILIIRRIAETHLFKK
jgi:hypothetical protein